MSATTAMNDDTYSSSIVTQINTQSDDNKDGNALNDVDDFFNASFMSNGVFSLQPKDSLSGYTIALEDKGTNLPGTLGLSQFFVGSDGATIDVNNDYKKDPSSMQGYSAPIVGNNSVANAMVQMQYSDFTFYRESGVNTTQTLEGFYRSVTTQIATDGEKAISSYDNSNALYNTVYSEYQSISGVNVDEELINLMKFQTAYNANAKIISTIDQMLDTLLGIKS